MAWSHSDNRDFTPFELYIKFHIEYLGSSVEFDPSSVTDLPEGFLRLSYQIDAVNQGFDLLRRHGGFFLANVVGLGKTIIAALIAKKFFYFNDFPAHISTTLIIVPPAPRARAADGCRHAMSLQQIEEELPKLAPEELERLPAAITALRRPT